jgi:hypothetical protein
MQRVLEALIAYNPAGVTKNEISLIDSLIQIIELSIYNKLRYGDIMGCFTHLEFMVINKALRAYYDNKTADSLASMFQKGCSV